jgi:ParB-like chromosome segregation protein Spo0J
MSKTVTLASVNPKDLVIIGGKALPKAEQGNNDTDPDPTHPRFDERLTKLEVSKEFAASIKEGILEAPQVVKTKNGLEVENGRMRVRAARLGRLQQILVLVKDEEKDDEGAALRPLTANVHHEDTMEVKIAKVKRLQEQGHTQTAIAKSLAVNLHTLKQWMAFDRDATDAVKSAVNSGAIPWTTGATIAKRGNAGVQDKALDKVLKIFADDGRTTGRSRAAAADRAISDAAGIQPGIKDRKSMHKLDVAAREEMEACENPSDKRWWEGVCDALGAILGREPTDGSEMLMDMVDDSDSADSAGSSDEKEPA